MKYCQFSFPTSILFGPGVRSVLPEKLQELGIKKPLLLTDGGVAKLSFFTDLTQALGKTSWGVFHDFEGNPLEKHVMSGVKTYQENQSDGIIALGGGAALDVAKAVALMVNHPGHLFDYEDGIPNAKPADQKVPTIIAIPTTAGTGSEVGRAAVISDNESKAKKIVFSPKLLPSLVLADPELTVGLPAKITATTGMDALSHCVEAYLAKGFHPMCDGIALEGIRLIAGYLLMAVQKPEEIEARSAMLMASMMGAVAFQKGLGITHSCAHALSTVYDLHHGLANGIMLPYCMEFNRMSEEKRFSIMAGVVGARSQDGTGFIEWLKDLRREIGIPDKLSRVGVDSIEKLVQVAYRDPCHQSNPRAPSQGDFEEIFTQAK